MDILQNVSEVLTREDLDALLAKKAPSDIVAYCGYETSGPVHLGHLVTIMKLKDLHDAGFTVKVLFADYHTWLNRKGGWDEIRTQAAEWETTFKRLGLHDAHYILGSTFQRSVEYMDDLLTLSLNATLHRGVRSMEQVARDHEHARISQILYPLMQIADIKHLQADIALGGMEQRKIHVLGREIGSSIGTTFIAIHTPLISSLLGEGKMSSSIPDSNISVNDTPEEIKRKISKAHCPPEGDNPILEIVRYIVYPYAKTLTITRPEKFGGSVTYVSYDELESAYTEKTLHPQDLKNAVSTYLIRILHGEHDDA